MNLNDLFTKKRTVTESQLNEVDPRNFDSDEDYYDAVRNQGKKQFSGDWDVWDEIASIENQIKYADSEALRYQLYKQIDQLKRDAGIEDEEDEYEREYDADIRARKGVAEAKSLTNKVKVVKGEHTGKIGWIREIKHGAFKGAPKSYFVDLEDGTQVNNVPGTSLRLVKDEQGVAEGSKYKCTCHPGDSDPDCPVHGLEPMDVGDALDVKEAGQKPGEDYIDPPEADYGDDYQAMVSRVKKLAGLGPLKTVYDPAKRVYRNMPTATQPKTQPKK